MPRSYRNLILAIGLILSGTSLPEPKAKGEDSNATKQVKPPSPTAPTAPAVQDIKPSENEAPCGPRQYSNNEDLCAQWKAADAARDAADYALCMLWLSIVGTVGLLFTLHYTRKAVLAAEAATENADDALEIARRNAEATSRMAEIAEKNMITSQRAYVLLESIDVVPCGEPDGQIAGWAITPMIKNTGRTQALNVKIGWARRVIPIAEAEEFHFSISKKDVRSFTFAPGSPKPAWPLGITFEELEDIQAGRRCGFVWGSVTYNDIFDPIATRTTLFAFEIRVTRPVRDISAVPINFIAWHKHNSAD